MIIQLLHGYGADYINRCKIKKKRGGTEQNGCDTSDLVVGWLRPGILVPLRAVSAPSDVATNRLLSGV